MGGQGGHREGTAQYLLRSSESHLLAVYHVSPARMQTRENKHVSQNKKFLWQLFLLRKNIASRSCLLPLLPRGQPAFSVNGQIVNLWSFADVRSLSQLLDSAVVAQKQSRQYINEYVRLCSRKALFIKTGGELGLTCKV